jgi:hypothetical protein
VSATGAVASKFTVNQSTGSQSLSAKFTINQTEISSNLLGEITIRRSSSTALPALFFVKQGSLNLAAVFRVTQEQLPAEFFSAKSRGRIDEVDVSTWGSTIVAAPGFEDTAIERIRRSQGAEPKWILFQTSEGEVRVYDLVGAHYPQFDLSLGYDPDDIYINNLDIPHIAVQSGTTIHVYRNGSELFNTGAITNLRYINLSNEYLHDTVAALGVEWRSLVDGSVTTTVSITMKDSNIWGPQVSEDGETVYIGYRDTSGSLLGWLTNVSRLLGVVWRVRYQTGGSVSQIRCSGDASLVVARLSGGGWANAVVYDILGTLVNSYAPGANFSLALDASPTASHAAWARIGTTAGRIIDRRGSYVDITLPSTMISNLDSVACLPGGYTAFACTNGSIYIYDIDGNLKDTITGADIATPMAWTFEDALPSFDDLKLGFMMRVPRSEELAAKFDVGQGSADLLASFDSQATQSLPAEFVARHATSQELKGSFYAQIPFENLLAGFSTNLIAGNEELLGEFEARQPGSQELPAKFVVRQASSQELLGEFDVRHSASQDLLAVFNPAQDIAELPAGFRVLNYPRTIGPSTVVTASGLPIPQRTWRGVFYAHGRHFAVWGETDGLYYRHSDDEGASWSADVLLRANVKYSYFCSVHFDGKYLHYAFCDSTGFGQPMRYRRGRIEPDGSITWSAAEQIAVPGWANHAYREMSVSVDNNGYPFISYFVFSFGADQYPTVTRSTKNDGTWVTETGYPLTLDPTSNGNWRTQIISLGASRMYAMWGLHGVVYGKAYDGANWSAKETISEPVNRVFQLTPLPNSAVIVSYNGGGGDVRMKTRTWGVGWGAESTIWDCNDTSIDHTLTARGSTLWAFFCTAYSTAQPSYVDWVAYLTSTDGGATWTNKSGGSTPNFWIDERIDDFSQIYTFSSAYREWEGVVGIVYQTDGPTKVRYAALRYYESERLKAIFDVGQDWENLKAGFEVGQDSQNLAAAFVSRQAADEDLPGEFKVRHESSQELFGEFEIRHPGSAELLGEFTSRQPDSEELLAEFIVRQLTDQELLAEFFVQIPTVELLGEFISRQLGSQELLGVFLSRPTDSQELFAEFISRHLGSQELLGKFDSRHIDSAELLGEFISRQLESQGLLGEFEARHDTSQELPAEFIVRHPDSQDLLAQFDVRRDSYQELKAIFSVSAVLDDSEDLPAEFNVRRDGSQELFAELVARHLGSQELAAESIVRHPGSRDLLGKFDVGRDETLELPGEFISRQLDSQNLLAGFIVRRDNIQELKSIFQVGQGSIELFSRFTARHPSSTELLAHFDIRLPWPLWTNRYWLNGVVQLDEAKISDSFLEEIIIGVMDDIKTWLIAEEIAQYSIWTNIDVTPRAIRRATTYGTVASLYARNIFSARDEVIRVAPMDVKVFTTSEAAMEYWEKMMNRVLELYLSGSDLLRIWIDTIDEDPVFTMEDIPLYTWSPDDTL